MFTLDQIKSAHSKVKSGADFPAYIRDLRMLGVISYETSVGDGHTHYFGSENHSVMSQPMYDALIIRDKTDAEQFKSDLKLHQQGKTNYPTFCSDCAKSGVEKWVVLLDQLTCTYFDKAGQVILEEKIPT